MNNIPKLIFQTSKDKKIFNSITDYYINKFKDYQYYHYDNQDIISYFNEHTITGFENIINKFYQIRGGPHKADLIRYYLLYLNGGIYFDTDIELVDDISNITKDYGFVGVITNEDTAFNGFIACTPRHPIIYNALKNIYENPIQSQYLYFCKKLMTYINEYLLETNDKNSLCLFQEHFISGSKTKITSQKNNEDIKMIHHYRYKKSVITNLNKISDPLDKVFIV